MVTQRSPDDAALALNIASVERDTRISKDTLRVWERRYGFPRPFRDVYGERLYAADEVQTLRLIKRLLDAGHRPSRIVGRDVAELEALARATQLPTPRSDQPVSDVTPEVAALLATVRGHDTPALRRQMHQTLLKMGLGPFVIDIAVPLCVAVGNAWARGELEVFEEHLCSEALSGLLRAALAQAGHNDGLQIPRVLLTTLPPEAHTLGLLMAEALLTIEGCACTNLGAQTPQRDLVMAADAHQAQVVAVSFTAAANAHQAVKSLGELRRALPPDVALWVGTPLPAIARRVGPRIQVFSNYVVIASAVAQWRRAHDSADKP